MSLFLGIDTSNYTTSVALYDSATGEIAQKKQLLPVREGQLGLRQSDAVFHHTAQLHTLFGELLEGVNPREIAAIGVSTRPRPVDGSYMPCFTVGENTAKILSSALRVPLFEYSHQEGHIAAALYSSKRDDLFDREFLAFHVSGGTTEAVIAKGDGFGFSVEPAAKTLDLNAGQAVDRVGLMLGLRFPCGMELERLANRCKKLLESGKSREYVAAFCIESIRVTLSAMTDAIFEKYGSMPVVYAGGVMSNKIIKNSFEEKYNAVFAEPVFSSDNAAGIAYLCFRKFENVYT